VLDAGVGVVGGKVGNQVGRQTGAELLINQQFELPIDDYSSFGRGEMLVFERYSQETFDESLAFARRWGLDSNMKETLFDSLATSVNV